MSDPVSSELFLAGYVQLTRRGFALPCFAANPRPNTWYTATCSVDGDHTGQITGFEVFESDDILRHCRTSEGESSFAPRIEAVLGIADRPFQEQGPVQLQTSVVGLEP
jgi:hypothetical protein